MINELAERGGHLHSIQACRGWIQNFFLPSSALWPNRKKQKVKTNKRTKISTCTCAEAQEEAYIRCGVEPSPLSPFCILPGSTFTSSIQMAETQVMGKPHVERVTAMRAEMERERREQMRCMRGCVRGWGGDVPFERAACADAAMTSRTNALRARMGREDGVENVAVEGEENSVVARWRWSRGERGLLACFAWTHTDVWWGGAAAGFARSLRRTRRGVARRLAFSGTHQSGEWGGAVGVGRKQSRGVEETT